MTEPGIYRTLEQPWLYRLAQRVLAAGAEQGITGEIHRLLAALPPAARLLDVGCGPDSWLWRLGLHPAGLDLSPAYSLAFHQAGEPAVTASAADLPFPAGVFGGVWSVGLLHHLPAALARRAVSEMQRVCRAGGYVAILDAVRPQAAWRRPLAAGIRRMDRGRFIRLQPEAEGLLPARPAWTVRRLTYTLTGLELVVCTWIKTPENERESAS